MPPVALRALQLFGLCGLAFAQPLFDVLGRGATFFVAHGAGRWTIVGFVAVVLVVPPLVLLAVVELVGVVSSSARRLAMVVLVGSLGSLTIVAALNRAASLQTLVFIALWLVLAVLIGWAYLRFAGMRTFVTFLSPAPLLFAGVFLVASPASSLVLSSDPAAAAGTSAQAAPVVVLVFDELPLGALLDESGAIDPVRFPGFARLASHSTWYPEATSVAPWTHLATPAILSGVLPDPEAAPVAVEYPRSLFTMLGGTHELHVTEAMTRLCPEALCGADASDQLSVPTLAEDSAVVLLHELLPTGLADSWLPPIDGQWAGFGDADSDGGGHGVELVEAAEHEGSSEGEGEGAGWQTQVAGDDERDQAGTFADFLASLEGGGAPGLWYLHEVLPHMPLHYLPDGTTYNGLSRPEGMPDWTDLGVDQAGIDVIRQRFMLQLAMVDAQVAATLDRLEGEGLLEPAMLVVVSDHGLSFQPGAHRRALPSLDDVNVHEVLPIPLFVKYPGQVTGAVDDRRALNLDVLPTVAEALQVELPAEWAFDGIPLQDEAPASRQRWWVTGAGPPKDVTMPIDARRMGEAMRALLGPGGSEHDLYAMGPHGALLGEPVGSIGAPLDEASFMARAPWPVATVEDGQPLPALVTGVVKGLASGDHVAVALGGRVAGVGRVFTDAKGVDRIEVMVDPSFLQAGPNRLEVYQIGGGGELRLVPVTG